MTEQELVRFTDEDQQQAQATAEDIEKFLSSIKADEEELAAGYVKLGVLLLAVRSKRYWLLWNFTSFGSYLESIRQRIEKGRTQVYALIGAVEKLLPVVGEERLVQMGVSKAYELKKLLSSGRPLSEDLIEKAADKSTGVQEIRAAVFEEQHAKADEKGRYFDFGGCFLSEDERAEIVAAIETAKRTDPPIQPDLPAWIQLKEVMLRFAREYQSTYAKAVEIGQA